MDSGLIEKRLAHVVSAVEQLRALGRPEALENDPVQLGFTIYTLQTAVQACLDTAALLVAERRLGEPTTNRELFSLIARDGWCAAERVDAWKRIVSFRNIVVHRYLAVDPAIVRSILEHNLEDLLDFVRDVRARLQQDS